MIYLTSDWHLDDGGLIRYCRKSIQHIKVLKKQLIDRYNKTVTDDDECYFLGDMSIYTNDQWVMLRSIVSKLNGKKYLILGNHDKIDPFLYIECGFTSVHTSLKMHYKDEAYYLIHDPSAAQIENTRWICGHVHKQYQTLFIPNLNTSIINVSVDVWDYTPVLMDTLHDLSNSMHTYKGDNREQVSPQQA